jgi:cysteine desulfurase
VIRALGADDQRARSAIRFSFGRQNTLEEVDRLIELLPASIEKLRKLSPASASATRT